MPTEKREMSRFSVCLCVNKINGHDLFGKVEDFSRKGMRMILDNFDIKEKDEVQVEMQQPDSNELVPITSVVTWKKSCEGKCEIGLKFKNFPAHAKAALLDYGYKKWLKGKSHPKTNF